MPLATFVPAVGPHASSSYALPYFKARPTFDVTFADDTTQPEQGSGLYVASGMGTSGPGGGNLNGVFIFFSNWLIANGYGTGSFGDMLSAIADFSRYVTMGGLGVLTDIPPIGMKIGGVIVDSRICTARISGTPSLDPQGDTSAELTVTIQNPSGLWTNQMHDGSKRLTVWPA